MIKHATAVWMLLAAGAIGALFVVKYRVQALEENLAAINRDVMGNLEAIHVLKAEWAYLNQPARLEDLGRRLLEMESVGPDQTAAIADIPFRATDDAAPPATPPSAAPRPGPAPGPSADRAAGPAPVYATVRETP